MKKNLITGLVLALFALICGLALSVVYSFTGPKIALMEEEKAKEALSYVLGTSDYTIIEEFNGTNYDSNSFKTEFKDCSKAKPVIKSAVKTTVNSNEFIVYTIETKGFASKITIMVSVSSDKKIFKSKVVSESETSGKDIISPSYNMEGKNSLDDFEIVSGATFSSKALKAAFEIAIEAATVDFGGTN